MDKKAAGLLGAVAGLATMGAAQAAPHPAPNPTDALQAASYADLLTPIANPVEALQIDNAARAQMQAQAAYSVLPADYWYNGRYYPGTPYGYYARPYPPPYYHHHHHHHHHHHYHHHHHHHHHGAFIGIPGVGGLVLRE